MRAREIASWNPRFFQGWNFHPKHLKFHHLVDWPIFWNFWWGLLTFYMKHSPLIHQPTKLMDRTVNILPDIRPIHLLHPFGSWNSASPPSSLHCGLHLQLVWLLLLHQSTGFLEPLSSPFPFRSFLLFCSAMVRSARKENPKDLVNSVFVRHVAMSTWPYNPLRSPGAFCSSWDQLYLWKRMLMAYTLAGRPTNQARALAVRIWLHRNCQRPARLRPWKMKMIEKTEPSREWAKRNPCNAVNHLKNGVFFAYFSSGMIGNPQKPLSFFRCPWAAFGKRNSHVLRFLMVPY